MSSPPSGRPASPGFEALGWGLAVASLLYAFLVHHGVGPSPVGLELRWYDPRAFLHVQAWLGWAFGSTPRLMAVLAFPALVLAAGCCIATPSAVARALSLSSVASVLLFAFYGEAAVRIWEFFNWRGSAVLTVTGLVLGFALAAPWLAASWLRLSWPLRALVWAPFVFVGVAFLRNATGTDPSLYFSISPWPAVSFYGIEVGAFLLMLLYAAAALASAGFARGSARAAALHAGLALAMPLAFLWLWDAAGLTPFTVDVRLGLALLAGSLLATAVAGVVRPWQAGARRARARRLAVAAALLAGPVLGGQLWARFDYGYTREHRAQQIIDAMERHLEREGLYPDELVDLVTAGDLAELPRPHIGFAFLDTPAFGYRGFGTSYLLDFPAPRWVECAYSPPYAADPEDADEALAIPEDGEVLPGSWTCPERPPELW